MTHTQLLIGRNFKHYSCFYLFEVYGNLTSAFRVFISRFRLIVLGYKKTLDENDIWDPNPRDLTRNNAPQFVKAWKKELYRCNWYLKTL